MPALVAGIHDLNIYKIKDVDGRNKSGHDEAVYSLGCYAASAPGLAPWRIEVRTSSAPQLRQA